MMLTKKRDLVLLGLIVVFVISSSLQLTSAPDEGMWTFDNPPVKQLQERYGFTPTQAWLDHVRLASVRFMDGGSGSFVSPNGLVLTNHHVAMGQLQKISTAEKNYVADGFLAATLEDEIKSPDLEVNILVSMEDVTKDVMKAVKPGMSDSDALKARDAIIAEIEKKSQKKTGLRSDVVSLYRGGEYWLYRYKKYTDVRLVMAPERQAAYFGGDSDNFTYPRYDLDFAFFRVYENDKPIKTEHYLKWNSDGAVENELVFVSGHPGSTSRLYTYSQLEFQRDFRYPQLLGYIEQYLKTLYTYSAKGQEQERRALGRIFGLENAKKALTGEYNGLLDEALMEKSKRDEEKFRKLIASNPEWQKEYGNAWDTIEKLVKRNKERAQQQFYRGLRGSQMAGNAMTIVRYVTEIKKPDADRLPGFHDSQLEELKFRLLSPAPIYTDLEEMVFADGLKMSLEALGPDDEFVKIILKDRKPEDVARDLVQGTKLADVELRKSLLEGGETKVQQSDDPLIVVARELDQLTREDEKWFRENIESKLTPASEKIAKARFAAFGKTTYPDATFTLRLTYGTVTGYPMNGTKAPYKTTLYGLYDRSLSFNQQGDFALPQRFWDKKDQLDLATPVNFVCTADIIGGNSGSPVVNKNSEIVGLIFDGNIESLPGRFVYNEAKNRAVSVHTGYILEAMKKLYNADALVTEILGK